MRNKALIGGGVLVLGGALFWFVLKPMFFTSSPPHVYTEEELAVAPRPTLTLPEVVLNLQAPAAKPTYVKVQLAIEFEDPDHKYVGLSPEAVAVKNESLAAELEPDLHRIKDVINAVVGAKTATDVSTPEGRDHLKDALVTALNDRIHEPHVEEVFFLTFIVQ